MNYRILILNKLLDKYEVSGSYSGVSAKRVMIRLLTGEFHEYNIENNENKELINSVIEELASENLIGFEWLKFEKGNIIEKIWLRLDSIDQAYSYADRKPKRITSDEISSLTDTIASHTSSDWIRQFLSDLKENLLLKKSARPLLPDDTKVAGAVLKALAELDKLGRDECLERVFSIKCYGDSKYFEKHTKKKLIEIARKYYPMESVETSEFTDDEILAQIGLVKSPEQIDFCGALIGRIGEGTVDFSLFKYGATINSGTVKNMDILDLPGVRKVLFIENKANYLDYVQSKRQFDELVIYHGGFYSPVRGIFFTKLYHAGICKRVEFYHWSDVDLGGFSLFTRLRVNIIPDLKSLLMDKDAFLSVQHLGMPFDGKYALKLKSLIDNPEYKVFHEVIRCMLECGIRVEQEAFLIETTASLKGAPR